MRFLPLAFLFVVLSPSLAPAQDWRLSLDVPLEYEGLTLPLELELPAGLRPGTATGLGLLGMKGASEPLPVQFSASRGTLLVSLPSCAPGHHELSLVESPAPSSAFALVESKDGKLNVLESGKPVLAYVFGRQLKPGVPEDRAREGYVHPIHDLDGTILTDDFPEDHHHHRGLSWMWPRVRRADGSIVDLWTLKGMEPRFDRFAARETGPVAVVLTAEGRWVCDGKPVVEERVTLRIARASAIGRIVDVELELRAVEYGVTLLGEPAKGYGGMGFRVGPRRDASIVTYLGREPGDRLHVRYPWADYSARFGEGDSISGIALMIHPDNAGSPPDWILRYYGYAGECWPGMGQASLSRDAWLRRSYRLFVHQGRAEDARVAAHDAAYARPPSATWLPRER